jgi:diphthamide synthase (EF-2-diphthine--ammonia ligase)
MVASGVKAVLTCIDPQQVSRTLAGREFDATLLAELPATCDPCGEKGEFHTFAWDGPAFHHAVPISVGEIVERDGFTFADIEPATTPVAVTGVASSSARELRLLA